MDTKYVTVQLQVPYGAAAGQPIQAVAPGNIRFTTYIPQGLVPGQVFNVRVPMKGGGKKIEIKEAAPPSSVWTFLPTISIGSDKYFKEAQTCGESCSISGICCPKVIYTNGAKNEEAVYNHSCGCCAACFGKFQMQWKGERVGSIEAAGCCEQPALYICCPYCYCGELISTHIYDSDDNPKFTTRRSVTCLQSLLVGCSICITPCSRCCMWCCSEKIYAKFEQPIYSEDFSDKKVIAKITYIERMTNPCLPNERMVIQLDPIGDVSEKDIALLSIYPFLIKDGPTCGMYLPYVCSCIGASISDPTGVPAIDEANYISGGWRTKEEALEDMRMI